MATKKAFYIKPTGGALVKHSLKTTLLLVALFLCAQYIGLVVVNSYIDTEATQRTGNFTVYELPTVAGVGFDRPELPEATSYLYIMGAVIIGTLLILLLIKFKTFNLWKVWFLVSVALCLTFAFGALLRNALPGPSGIIVANVLGLGAALWKVFKPNPWIHNLTELFIYGGLASIFFPFITVWAAAILLLLISLYDMYAVWHSKHMVTMATFQTQSGMFAGLLVPAGKAQSTPPHSTKTQPTSASTSTPAKGHVKYTAHEPSSAGKVRGAVLGGGDIGFPLLFAAAILKQQGMAVAAIIPVFAAIALFGLLYFAKKDRFYPAMPFISAGCAAGFLVTLLL